MEAYLSGREFTVGLLGTGGDAEAFGVLEVILLENAEQGVYSYQNKENCEECVKYVLVKGEDDPIVKAAQEVSLLAWRALGCRDGGRVDLRCDASGAPHFLEVNPLAGLHPQHSDLPILCNQMGIPYIQLINRIVSSAAIRISSLPSQMMRMRKCV